MPDAKPVQRGDALQIRAETWNYLQAGARLAHRQNLAGRGNTLREVPTHIVWVRNDSDDDRNPFDILGVGDVLPTPADNLDEFKFRAMLKGVNLDADDHYGNFVICQEAIPHGKIGRAVIFGCSPCLLHVTTQTEDCWFADVHSEQHGKLFAQGDGGAEILWRYGGTGEQHAFVKLGFSTNLMLGTLGGTLLRDDSAPVTEKTGEGGDEEATERSITAWGFFVPTGKKIVGGARVLCARINRYWYVIQSDTCAVNV